jgi:hypothetical protein
LNEAGESHWCTGFYVVGDAQVVTVPFAGLKLT